MRTLLIAEAGSSHAGSLIHARELVRIAKQAGATAVKFQYWSDPEKLAAQRGHPELAEAYAAYSLPADWLPELSRLAHEVGLSFLCTAYLPEDVAVVEPYVDAFKVSSFEAEYRPLLAAHLPFLGGSRKLYVSLGMGATLGGGWPHAKVPSGVFPVHCVSGYPVVLPAANLEVVSRLRDAYGAAGYSDHVNPLHRGKVLIGALAVAAGASVVEAHIRLDATPRGNPDYPHSMPPDQFADYAWHIETAERALGDGKAGAQAAETDMLKYRSIEREDSRVAQEEVAGKRRSRKPAR